MKSIITLLLLLGLTTSLWAKDHPYDAAFEAKVQQLFMDNGQVSPLKLEAYRKRVQQKRAEIIAILQNQYIAEEGQGQRRSREEATEHKYVMALEQVLNDLPRLQAARSMGPIMEEAKHLLDVEAAIRIEGQSGALIGTLRQIRNYLRSWVIRKNVAAEEQASNLYLNGSYLSPSDIRDQQKRGVDISLINPGPSSTFWQKQDNIALVDVKDAARGKTLKIFEGAKPKFPDVDTYIYEEMKLSDTKPKMDVHYLDEEGKKVKFKLKFGAETNADPTVAAVLMTLGFPADMTKNVKNIRVVLGKDLTLSDVKREWELYYRRDRAGTPYKIEDYIKESGTDAAGSNYVVFKEGLIEAKPKDIERLGGWSFADHGHSSLREVRVLSLVQMWLDNTDIKEFENNRLIFNTDKKATQKRAHIISDVGHALGGAFLEMPELYPATMVAGQSASAINIRYRSFHPTTIKNKLTYEDARWGTRLIAAMTRKQIKDAVQLGKWPKCMERIYVEKLISRRNDLVKALKLTGTLDSNGKKIELYPVDLSSETINFDLACDEEELERDYTSNYDFDLGFLLKPVGLMALRTVLDTVRGTLNDTRHLTLSHAEVGLDRSAIAQVIINVSRTYEKNPFPTTEQDLFIFQDHMEIGMRLGASYGVFKDWVYTRHFTLSYPARSVEEGRFQNGFIANVLLPLDVAQGKLPEKYVLKTEHHFESGFGVELDNMTGVVSPTVRARKAKILLLRSFLDHRDKGQYLVYRDRAKHDEASLKLFLRISILKLPLMETLRQWGGSQGVGSRFQSNAATEGATALKLQKALINGDFKELEDHETKFRLRADFSARAHGWDLFFWQGHSDNRLERIRIYDAEEEERRDGLQLRTRRDRSWSFLGNKEKRELTVEVFSAPNMSDETMHLNVIVRGTDTTTSDQEMDQNYLFFVNGLSANGTPLIPLTVGLGYTTNGKWGPTVLQSRTTYYHEGLKRILGMSRADFNTALAQSQAFMNIPSAVEARTLNSKANLVWKKVLVAKAQKTIENKMRALTQIFNKAVYQRRGFYESRLLGALNRIAGQDNLFTTTEIGAPDFEEQNLLNEAPFYGQQGKERPRYYDYMVYVPLTPTDLYFMFDFWR